MTSRGTAFVTGSAGFIGRHMVARLEADSWQVTKCDVKYGNDCRDIFRTNVRFDLVVHCAAVVGGRMTIDREPMKVATDLAIDSDFFQWVLRTEPWRAVYFSSSAAYPISLQRDNSRGPLAEDDLNLDRPGTPDAIYGWVKLTGEKLARYANAQGANIHVFRPFSGYGADQDLDYPFPSLIQRAAQGDGRVEVWGDGYQVRDFIHVSDVVRAVMAVLPRRPANVGPLNLCTGRPTTFRQLIGLARPFAEIQPLLDKPVGVHWRVGDPSAMHRYYQPRMTLLDGVAEALAKI